MLSNSSFSSSKLPLQTLTFLPTVPKHLTYNSSTAVGTMFAHLSVSWINVSPGGIHGRTFGCSIKYQEAHFLSSFPAAQFVLHLESRWCKLFPFSSSSSNKKPNGGRPTMQMKHLGQEKAQWNYTALNKNKDFRPQREVMVRNRGIKILPLWGNAKFCIKKCLIQTFLLLV